MSKARRRRLLKAAAIAFALIGAALGVLYLAAARALDTTQAPPGALQRWVTSRDGTVIAYERTGAGPAVILVAAALADRGGARRVAGHLAARFTVINYDRRGRGQSTDNQPHHPPREIEDLQALVEASGGAALLFGTSSGAVLALDAAAALGTAVKGVFLYEPPLIVDASHPPVPPGLSGEIAALVSAGRRDDAVGVFFAKGMGIPPAAVTLMRFFMPGWSQMTAIAHTIPYDLALLEGLQTGRPLSGSRWSGTTAPVLVAVGGRSEPFFHSGAKALASSLPNTRYRTLDGLDHSAILMGAQPLAAAAARFFSSARPD